MEIPIFITAIAALFTSIVTMLTVIEMKRQRIVTHKPILKVAGNSFELVINKHGEWLWGKNKTVQLFNFGSGVAIDIEVNWNIDESKIIQLLKKYDPYNQKEFGKKGYLLALGNSMHNIEIQKKIKIPAIPTFNNSNEATKINIPSFFISGYSQYIKDAIFNRPSKDTGSEKLFETFDLEDYTPAFLKIEYKDINENLYSNTFELTIKMTSINKPKNDENGSAFLYYEIKEIV